MPRSIAFVFSVVFASCLLSTVCLQGDTYKKRVTGGATFEDIRNEAAFRNKHSVHKTLFHEIQQHRATEPQASLQINGKKVDIHNTDAEPCNEPESLTTSSASKDFPVDFVYTWVQEPTESEWPKFKEACPGLGGSPQRFRNLNTFRFSLRLLEKNVPWVRKVFIVTAGEVPKWLNTSHPEIQMVSHKDIWPEDRWEKDQPIHNSEAIEAHLHRIPGLADHFVYFNDDVFTGRPLERSFFFTDSGAPVIHDTGLRRNPGWCLFRKPEKPYCLPNCLPINADHHMHKALTIPLIKAVQDRWPLIFSEVSGRHCRGEWKDSISPARLYGRLGIDMGITSLDEAAKVAWMNDRVNRTAWYEDGLRDPPQIGCINDDFEINNKTEFIHQKNELLAWMKKFAGDAPTQIVKKMEAWSLLALSEGHTITEHDDYSNSLLASSSTRRLTFLSDGHLDLIPS